MPVARQTPGVYLEEAPLPAAAPPSDSVPLFLGLAKRNASNQQNRLSPERLMLWADFERRFELPPAGGYLAAAVRGFFANGGQTCFVWPFEPGTPIRGDNLAGALLQLEGFADADLLAIPDIMV